MNSNIGRVIWVILDIGRVIRVILLIGLGVLYIISMSQVVIHHRSHSIEVRPPEVVLERYTEVNHNIPTIVNTPDVAAPFNAQDMLITQAIAEAVMGESGGEPLIGKVAVAMTILNRMDYYNQSVYQALEAYNAYPYHGVVIEECYRAVEIAINNRDLFPADMMYFRAGGYHDFGVPYVQIGNHYFSTKE